MLQCGACATWWMQTHVLQAEREGKADLWLMQKASCQRQYELVVEKQLSVVKKQRASLTRGLTRHGEILSTHALCHTHS